MTLKKIDRATDWWDNGTRLTVPAGETVELLKIEQVPTEDRSSLKAGIHAHKKMGQTFVPIKIRDWYAIIDETWITADVPAPQAPQTASAASKHAKPQERYRKKLLPADAW